ncbi:MAG: hypothetical protein MZV70_48850 [Desulfobacterales bacterium]|nr:hypothetical protein [Desulfobacterales bacterium]
MKQWVVGQYARQYGLSTLIETGTYEGDMVEAMKDYFCAIHSIEIFEPLYWKAVEKFCKFDHIHLYYGDSENLLPTILEKWTNRSCSGSTRIIPEKERAKEISVHRS